MTHLLLAEDFYFLQWLLNIPTVTVEFHLLPPEYSEVCRPVQLRTWLIFISTASVEAFLPIQSHPFSYFR